jgi:hypothetical protein
MSLFVCGDAEMVLIDTYLTSVARKCQRLLSGLSCPAGFRPASALPLQEGSAFTLANRT